MAAMHRVEISRYQGMDATANLLSTAVVPLLDSLKGTQDAIIRVGAVLIVKSDGAVFVYQLTGQQQLMLDHSPDLLTAPERVLQALGRSAGDDLLAGADLPAGVRLAAGAGLPGGSRLSVSGGFPERDPLPAGEAGTPEPPAASVSGGFPERDRLPAGEAGVPEPLAAVDRPYRRSLTQAFTDGIDGVFDIFGGIQRQRWSRPPAFEDTLATDARELCRELGLIPDGGNGSKEGTNR
jgi:hypothetical protein